MREIKVKEVILEFRRYSEDSLYFFKRMKIIKKPTVEKIGKAVMENLEVEDFITIRKGASEVE